MIPILYEKTEASFTSNGLGRLRDCLSCVVTEERNGIYECDFEYPVDGASFDKIVCGRIIGVTHDDSGDIQPFDIVSYSKPIDGIVTFHAVHISYRQRFMTVTGKNINSLASAFTLFKNATPSNPFSYSTDKTSTGFLASADGVPKSVRSMLGGIEGSVLDAYGGEYEWDKWRVILHTARGEKRSFTVRYGVNMLDFTDETDYDSTYSSCIPYWTDNTNTVVASRVDSNGSTITGRGECVPLDLSEKFDDKPTKAQLRTAAAAYMASNNTWLPSQNIEVEFVRLQDMSEYSNFASLLKCKLCDTINVVFPDQKSSGTFKIVKTVWDVLKGKYESMELGALSVSLADALGVNDNPSRIASTSDFVKSKGSSGNWYYEVWESGKVEAWGKESTGTLSMSASGNMYRAVNVSIAIPSGIFDTTPQFAQVTAQYGSGAVFVAAMGNPTSTTAVNCTVWKATSATASVDLSLHVVYYPSDY